MRSKEIYIFHSSNKITISAALSSLSSGLNSMSAVVLEDYFKPFFKKGLSDDACGYIMRGTVLFLGVISIGLVYVVQHLGSVLQLSMSVPATCIGSLFGIFTIGMFLPWINKRATFYGALIASSLMIYWVARAQYDMAHGHIHFDTKPTSTEGCDYNFTIVAKPTPPPTPVAELNREFHHISYLYYMPLGAIITCLSAFILSFVLGFEDPNSIDPQLLAPFMRKYFASKAFQSVEDNNDGSETLITNFEMKKTQIE